mmetsp:Transcript_19519/g.55498  ORF Transcript_19519/g.55498 Transcript_19519/m.55498 type:complete len:210 (+) Transcript_19519:1853-2482(+)
MAAPAPEELEAGGARVRARESRENHFKAAELRPRVGPRERVAHARKRPGVPSLGPGPLQSFGRGPRAEGVAVARELERVPPLSFRGADDARQLRVALEDAQLHVRRLPRRAGPSQQIARGVVVRLKGQRPPDIDVQTRAPERVEERAIRFELRAAAVRDFDSREVAEGRGRWVPRCSPSEISEARKGRVPVEPLEGLVVGPRTAARRLL